MTTASRLRVKIQRTFQCFKKSILRAGVSWEQVLPLLSQCTRASVQGCLNAKIIVFFVELCKGFKPVGELNLKDAAFCWVLQESGIESTFKRRVVGSIPTEFSFSLATTRW